MNPSATIFNSVTSKNTFTAVLIPALFLAFALGLAGCDTPAGTGETGVESSGSEANKTGEASEYEIIITDLGTLGGENSEAFSINDKGQIVGVSDCENGEKHAFLWEDGKMESLGKLGGTFRGSSAAYINEAGQVVGINDGSHTRLPRSVAFLWENGTMFDLSFIPPGGRVYSNARSINNKGLIVGYYTPRFDIHEYAVMWEDDEIIELGTLGGNRSQAMSINEAGQVVGTSTTNNYFASNHAFLWEEGKMIDLGTLGGERSDAYSINEAGQIAGSSKLSPSSSVYHAFLWEDSEMTDLGTLLGERGFSYALSINDKGQVVGYSDYTVPYVSHAFFWEDGVMVDLGDLVAQDSLYPYSRANSINNKGQIVGASETLEGKKHAVLWEIKEIQD